MAGTAYEMHKRLREQWHEAQVALGRLAQGASARPTDGWEIIKHADDPSTPNAVKFNVLPVVFNVPERADHSNTELFVVVEGLLELKLDDFEASGALVTHAFSTRAGYFRWKAGALHHVYGAHYDVAIDQLGHPAFHSQMRSFAELHQHIATQYSISDPVEDQVKGVLRNVRLPTAQMDFFSFLLQVFADHLLLSTSTPEERAAFNSLLTVNESLRGAGSRSGRLLAEGARSCYRALHWYPVIA